MRNIALITNSSIKFDENSLCHELGGSETWMIQLSEALKNDNNNIYVVCNCKEHTAKNGVSYISNRNLKSLKDKDIDVYVISKDTGNYVDLIKDFDKEANILVQAHMVKIQSNKGTDLSKIGTDISGFVCLTDYQKNELKKNNNIDLAKVSIIPNGIDLSLFTNKGYERDNCMLWSSAPDRGLDWFSKEVIPLVKMEIPDFKVYVCSHSHTLETYKRINLNGVEILGYLNKDELYDEMQKHKVWCYPCKKTETFCITALEAIMSENDIILPDKFAFHDLFKNYPNVFCEDKAEEYAKRIVDSIRSYDDNFHKEIRRKLKDYVINNYTWDIVANKYLKLIEEVCDKKRDETNNCVDLVISYVNSDDENWVSDYLKYKTNDVDKSSGLMRFKDFGFLPFFFRGIEKCMPFVRKVHLLVASESQVPMWVNMDKVNVVLHEQFIPIEHLPTFNSQTIEMYLWNIEGLSDKFIYANDDMYPIKEMKESDFFEDDKICLSLRKRPIVLTKKDFYDYGSFNATRLASNVSEENSEALFTNHSYTPMVKHRMVEFYQAHKAEIDSSCTRFRDLKNINQYLWCDVDYYNNKQVKKPLSSGVVNLQTSYKLAASIVSNKLVKVICMNDNVGEDNIEIEDAINKAFKSIFPNKSKFELYDTKNAVCEESNAKNDYVPNNSGLKYHVKRDSRSDVMNDERIKNIRKRIFRIKY